MNTPLQPEPKLRRTGIGAVGDVPWGTHFFLFYEAKEDLIETVVPYFHAGLEDGEFCMWVVPEPLTHDEALVALRRAIPSFDRYRAERSLELVHGDEWYLHDNQLDVALVARKWNEKLDYALSHGYSGLRLAGSTAWLAKKDWKEFCEYEKAVNDHITDSAMTALCTYPLHGSAAEEILDVMRTHQFAIARRQGNWEVIETSELKQAKAEIKKLNDELEQRVVQRTAQLLALNQELTAEMEHRRRAEEELRRSEAYQADAQRLSRTGSFGWQVSSGQISWSEETYRIFGYDRATKPTLELILERTYPDDRDLVQQVLAWASKEGTHFDTEHRLLMPDGAVKYLHVVAHGQTDSSGNLEFVGAVIDITKEKHAEDALRKSEEQWRDVFENNPTMYFMVDAAGNILAINPFGAEQLGYDIAELVGRPLLGVLRESDREAVQEKLALCLEQIGRARTWEAWKVRKDGTSLRVRETAKAVARVDGPIVLIACEDITEQRKAEEALRQAQADLLHANRVTTMGELTASLAHEVKQPIAAAITDANTCMRWLGRDRPDLEEAREAAMRIVKDGQRAGEIISRISLLFDKGTPERAVVHLNEVIKEMIILLRGEATQYNISVRTELAAALPKVMGDRVQLQQVLMNLMINGIDAMKGVDGMRQLTIRSHHADNEQVQVSVSDSGVGLPPQHANEIFNPFFTTKPHGTGMGLRISRSIIESHGGRLWAADNSPRGASFHFTLPAKSKFSNEDGARSSGVLR